MGLTAKAFPEEDFVAVGAVAAAAADLLMTAAPVLGLVGVVVVDDVVDAIAVDFRFFAGGTGVVLPERR